MPACLCFGIVILTQRIYFARTRRFIPIRYVDVSAGPVIRESLSLKYVPNVEGYVTLFSTMIMIF